MTVPPASSDPVGSPVDMSAYPSRALLRMYADILTVLNDRQVIRSRNAPAGDLAEHLVAVAYEGTLAPASMKSWDVGTPDGRRLQVKTRVLRPKGGSQNYSSFRSWDFDACVFVHFDPFTYEVVLGLEVPMEQVRALGKPNPHVGETAFRLTVASPLAAQPGARDVTGLLRDAMAQLP